MSGVSFMNGVPGCCCCNDLYSRSNKLEQHRLTGVNQDTYVKEILGIGFDNMAYDWLNKRLFLRLSNQQQIVSYKEDLTDYQVHFTRTLDGAILRGICVHPWAGYIFYGHKEPQATDRMQIRRCRYDGSDDQEIWGFTDDSTGVEGTNLPQVHSLTVSRTGVLIATVLFDHFENPAVPGPDVSDYDDQVIAMDLNGGGATTIYTETDNGKELNLSTAINNNERLYYFSTRGDLNNTIYAMDFTGANRTGIVEHPPTDTLRIFGYSHERQRLYYWRQPAAGGNTNPARGLWSVGPLGQNPKIECQILSWGHGASNVTDPIYGRLGCGFDKTGNLAVNTA